jgi:hypothetical protein
MVVAQRSARGAYEREMPSGPVPNAASSDSLFFKGRY